jgi:hypothetical protein
MRRVRLLGSSGCGVDNGLAAPDTTAVRHVLICCAASSGTWMHSSCQLLSVATFCVATADMQLVIDGLKPCRAGSVLVALSRSACSAPGSRHMVVYVL